MKQLTNMGTRRLGIAGRHALILNPRESAQVTDAQVTEMKKNRTTARWLEAGVLVLTGDDGNIEVHVPIQRQKRSPAIAVRKIPRVDRDKREEAVLPEGVEGEGVEHHHAGGGWWDVYVNGFKVTDRKVRKDEAESIAAEYE